MATDPDLLVGEGPTLSTEASPRGRLVWLRRLIRSPGPLAAAVVLVACVVVALFAPELAPHSPNATHLAEALRPPGTPGYVLGTDPLGRDLLSRVLYGGRVSLVVGFSSAFAAGLIGVPLGLVAGYKGGIVDDVLMRIADVQLSFPFLLLALIVIAALGSSLQNLLLVLILQNWVYYARVVRSQALQIRTLSYVEAARAMGQTEAAIVIKHVWPQVTGTVIAVMSFTIAQAMIAEAALSFLGVGVPPPTADWGSMLHDNMLYIFEGWWTVVDPCAALVLVILSLNVFGDWLRDYFDPNLKI